MRIDWQIPPISKQYLVEIGRSYPTIKGRIAARRALIDASH
jgi:hypothetical protein